jgi:hypothetical protein
MGDIFDVLWVSYALLNFSGNFLRYAILEIVSSVRSSLPYPSHCVGVDPV